MSSRSIGTTLVSTPELNILFIVAALKPCLPEKGFPLVSFGISLKVVFVFLDFEEAELDFEMRLNFSGFSKIRPPSFKEAWLKISMH